MSTLTYADDGYTPVIATGDNLPESYPVRLTLDPDHFGKERAGRVNPIWLERREAQALYDQLQVILFPPDQYVEVKLLDATGYTSDGQRKLTWSYINPMDDDLAVGDLVHVPFGWNDTLLLAKVVRTGPEPEYQGPSRIKEVAHRVKVVPA